MLNNNPKVRAIIYVAALVTAVVSIMLKPISPEWSEGIGNVAVYLGGAAGVSAVTNLSGPTQPTR